MQDFNNYKTAMRCIDLKWRDLRASVVIAVDVLTHALNNDHLKPLLIPTTCAGGAPIEPPIPSLTLRIF
jgi:hypothetical protein